MKPFPGLEHNFLGRFKPSDRVTINGCWPTIANRPRIDRAREDHVEAGLVAAWNQFDSRLTYETGDAADGRPQDHIANRQRDIDAPVELLTQCVGCNANDEQMRWPLKSIPNRLNRCKRGST